jgi:hypothetical protein
MDIRPYRSGRKGLHVPLEVAPEAQEFRLGNRIVREESFALDARITQEDAYCHAANGSLRYLLLLSGVLPNIAEIDDPELLHQELNSLIPDACPGATGPIAILLIL